MGCDAESVTQYMITYRDNRIPKDVPNRTKQSKDCSVTNYRLYCGGLQMQYHGDVRDMFGQIVAISATPAPLQASMPDVAVADKSGILPDIDAEPVRNQTQEARKSRR